MPPKCKFTKEKIIDAALEITRHSGFEAATARAIGEKLDSSSKVIFSLFQNMEELRKSVINAANKIYQDQIDKAIVSGEYPPYMASGMAYINFAKNEKELFKLLFMRDRSSEPMNEGTESLKPIIELVRQKTGLDEKQAFMFHMQMWVVVHGIATMIATSYLEWDKELIEKFVKDSFTGLKSCYLTKEDKNESN